MQNTEKFRDVKNKIFQLKFYNTKVGYKGYVTWTCFPEDKKVVKLIWGVMSNQQLRPYKDLISSAGL